MISKESIKYYKGAALNRGDDFLHIPPHYLLRPYISNYTVTFPTPLSMPDEYTVLPSASSTLTVSVSSENIISKLRGVGLKSCNIGTHANRMELILLIEFRPGALYPFISVDQMELIDSSFGLDDLDKKLRQNIEDALIKFINIDMLIEEVNHIFISRLMEYKNNKNFVSLIHNMINRHGDMNVQDLSSELNYSEKHIRRIFLRYLGASPKTFSRIIRVNYALRLMQETTKHFAEVAVQAGFFDQPHFIHDLKSICGLTPEEFSRNMSVFYNDKYKM